MGVTPCALGGDVQQRGSVVTDNVSIRVAGVEARAASYTPCGGSREAPGWLGRVSGPVPGLCRAHCLQSWLAGVDQQHRGAAHVLAEIGPVPPTPA